MGFFHPFTNDGGGGERVLWCAVRAVQEMATDLPIAIYTGDPATPESLALRALDRFGVKLLQPIRVSRVLSTLLSSHIFLFPFLVLDYVLAFWAHQIRSETKSDAPEEEEMHE